MAKRGLLWGFARRTLVPHLTRTILHPGTLSLQLVQIYTPTCSRSDPPHSAVITGDSAAQA